MAERIPFRGGLTCSCVVESLPWVEKELRQRGIINGPLRIFQLGYRGDVSASAGTHDKGGCIDIQPLSATGIDVFRLWGWTMQDRSPQFKQDHCHGWPYKCEHLAPAAQQQEADWDRRDAGLVGPGKVQGRWPVDPWNVALRKRKPLLDQPIGVPIMADAREVRASHAGQKLAPGGVRYIHINEEKHTSVIVGATEGAEVFATVGVEGLQEGEWVDVSWQIDWKTDTDTKVKEPNAGVTILRAPGMPARRYGQQIAYAERVPKADKGWVSCLRLVYATNSETAKIGRVQINGWKL